jgi:GntR family transcriptional regulator
MIERPKSITQQVIHLIQERIETGKYAPNSQIPSEIKLSEELSVSRSTVRSAMATLAARGLVIRRHGFGTYVIPRIPDLFVHIAESWDLNRRIEASGRTPRIVDLAITHRHASQEEANVIEISAGDEIIYFRRLIYADDKPMLLSNNIVSADLIRSMGIDKGDETALKLFLNDYCLTDYAEIVISIKSVLATSDSSEMLQIATNDPILELEELYFDHEHRPLTLGRNYYVGPDFRLRLVHT